jgi:hypothetical protein
MMLTVSLAVTSTREYAVNSTLRPREIVFDESAGIFHPAFGFGEKEGVAGAFRRGERGIRNEPSSHNWTSSR